MALSTFDQTQKTLHAHFASGGAQIIKNKTGMANDAFNQVFTDLQKIDLLPQTKDNAPVVERRPDDAKPVAKADTKHADAKVSRDDHEDDDRADAADAVANKVKKADGVKKSKKAADADDDADDDKKADAIDDKVAAPKVEAVADAKIEVKEEAPKVLDVQVEVHAEAAPVKEKAAPEVTEAKTADAAPKETAAQAPAQAAAPTDAALALAAAAQAKPEVTAQPVVEEHKEQKTEKHAAKEAAQAPISFRADAAVRDEHAAAPADDVKKTDDKKKGDDAPVFAVAADDVKAAATDDAPKAEVKAPVEVKTKLAPTLQASAHANANAGFKNNDAPSDNSARDDKKDAARTTVSAAAPATPKSEEVSYPAAGTRATALSGFSAPPSSNGIPGGGTPLNANGAVKAAAPNVVTLQAIANVGATQNAQAATTTAALARGREAAATMQPGEQVAVQLFKAAKNGDSRFDVQLHPAELGRVDVRVEISKDGFVRVSMTADNPAAYDALQKDGRTLERALQQAGLQTDSGSLSFNLRGGDAQQQQAQQQNGMGGQQNRGWAPLRNPESEVGTEVAQNIVFNVANGRVDLRV